MSLPIQNIHVRKSLNEGKGSGLGGQVDNLGRLTLCYAAIASTSEDD